jgi:hypothetical protein
MKTTMSCVHSSPCYSKLVSRTKRCGKHGKMPCPTHLWFVKYELCNIFPGQRANRHVATPRVVNMPVLSLVFVAPKCEHFEC